MRKRKLLSSKLLFSVESRVAQGVPLALIIRKMELDISRPALAKLLKHSKREQEVMDDSELIEASLYPQWLDSNSLEVQTQPEDWCYKGYFPLGEWING